MAAGIQSNAQRFDKILRENGICDEGTPPDSARFDAMAFDSLDIVELVMALEEEFSIEITDDELQAIQTVGDARKLVEKYS